MSVGFLFVWGSRRLLTFLFFFIEKLVALIYNVDMEYEEIYLLAELIKKYIQKDFEQVHLSGYLAKTIEIKMNQEYIEVRIPAKAYNIHEYVLGHNVIYDQGDISYASEVNETGGFSGKHKDYVERAISEAIKEWCAKINKKGVIVKKS